MCLFPLTFMDLKLGRILMEILLHGLTKREEESHINLLNKSFSEFSLIKKEKLFMVFITLPRNSLTCILIPILKCLDLSGITIMQCQALALM